MSPQDWMSPRMEKNAAISFIWVALSLEWLQGREGVGPWHNSAGIAWQKKINLAQSS